MTNRNVDDQNIDDKDIDNKNTIDSNSNENIDVYPYLDDEEKQNLDDDAKRALNGYREAEFSEELNQYSKYIETHKGKDARTIEAYKDLEKYKVLSTNTHGEEINIRFEPKTPTSEPMVDLIQEMREYSGYRYEYLFAKILMDCSRTIGPLIKPKEDDMFRYYPNLYIWLVGDPGETNKSSIVTNNEFFYNRVNINSGLKSKRYQPGTPETGLSDTSIQLEGSSEKIGDIISRYRVVHLRGTEADVLFDEKQKKAYHAGIFKMLQELYYGAPYDVQFRGAPIRIPSGTYVTLFGDLHLDVLSAQAYKLGTVRRSIFPIVYLKDINPHDPANKFTLAYYEADNRKRFNMLETIYENMFVRYIAKLVDPAFMLVPPSEQEKIEMAKQIHSANLKKRKDKKILRGEDANLDDFVDKKKKKRGTKDDIDDEDEEIENIKTPDKILKYNSKLYRYQFTDQAHERLKQIRSDGAERIYEEETLRHQSENSELVARTAINIMIFENVYYDTQIFTVTKEHVEKAFNYLKLLDVNYSVEIQKAENIPQNKQAQKMVKFIKKWCTDHEQEYMSKGDLLRFYTIKDKSELDIIINYALTENDINCITVYRKGLKPTTWVFAAKEDNESNDQWLIRICDRLDTLKDEGRIDNYKVIDSVQINGRITRKSE